MTFAIEMGFDNGTLVAHAPEIGATDGVKLSTLARRMAARGEIVASGELYEYLDSLGGPPEVSGKIANKIKKGVKKAATKVVKTATKVAKSKVAKSIYGAVKSVIPQPYKAGLAVAETGVKFTKAAAKKGSPQSKALPLVKKLIAKTITPAAATKAAQALGVNPDEVKAAAITSNIAVAAANGDQGAQTVVDAVNKIEGSDVTAAIAFGAEARIRAQYPDAQVMTVTDANGLRRLTAVIPIS
jgi:hypothetical protein